MLCWTQQHRQLPRDCFNPAKNPSKGMQVHPLQNTPQLLLPSQALREEEE